MKTLILMAAGAFALAGCTTCGHPDSTGPEWTDVFNADLSNAECGKPGWKWTDGYLVPGTGETLFSKKDYGPNFTVDLVYVVGKDANSGVFLYDTEHPKKKFEVQIMDDRSDVFRDAKPYQRSGSLYGRCAANAVRSRPAGEENRLTVRCDDGRVRIVLNGHEVVDTDLADYTDPLVNPDGTPIPPYHKGFPAMATIPHHGRIGLQGIHNTTSAVRFKYIKVKEN